MEQRRKRSCIAVTRYITRECFLTSGLSPYACVSYAVSWAEVALFAYSPLSDVELAVSDEIDGMLGAPACHAS